MEKRYTIAGTGKDRRVMSDGADVTRVVDFSLWLMFFAGMVANELLRAAISYLM